MECKYRMNGSNSSNTDCCGCHETNSSKNSIDGAEKSGRIFSCHRLHKVVIRSTLDSVHNLLIARHALASVVAGTVAVGSVVAFAAVVAHLCFEHSGHAHRFLVTKKIIREIAVRRPGRRALGRKKSIRCNLRRQLVPCQNQLTAWFVRPITRKIANTLEQAVRSADSTFVSQETSNATGGCKTEKSTKPLSIQQAQHRKQATRPHKMMRLPNQNERLWSRH